MRLKQCKGCGESKDIETFGWYGGSGTRRRDSCEDCTAFGPPERPKRSPHRIWPEERLQHRCSSCRRVLPTNAFGWYREVVSQRQRVCRECLVGDRKSYREKMISTLGIEEVRAREREAVRLSREEQSPGQKDRSIKQRRAYSAAMQTLRERHLEEFDQLYDVEKAKLGLETRPRTRGR